MSYTVRIRTLPGSPMMAEYECPDCGRFERLVSRDENGDPPSSVECEGTTHVDASGVWSEGAPGDTMPFPCGLLAELVISAPSIANLTRAVTPIGYASKSDEKDPRALDTEPLATGKMTRSEWRKWQRGISRERRFQKRLKAGKISKRVQVGGG